MAKSMSLAELSKLYSTANKAPAPLGAGSLPGSTVKEKLSKLLFSRESSKLFPSPSSLATMAPVTEQKTVAICLVIVDTLHHETIWRRWIEQGEIVGSHYKARLFIHAKFPEKIKSEWVRERCLSLSYMPEWNSPEVIRSMLAALHAALKDPYCGRFVFGTESCLPIYNLQEAAHRLFADDKSWLDAFHEGKTSWERAACFVAVDDRVVPPKAVWKAIPGWIMLTRRHAAEINLLCQQSLFLENPDNGCVRVEEGLGLPRPLGSWPDTVRGSLPANPLPGILGDTTEADLVRAWGTGAWSEGKPGVWAPEEVFFATMLSLLGYLRKSGTDEVLRRKVTFARWQKHGDPNPIAYTQFTTDLVETFRSAGSVFGRKFSKEANDVGAWQAAIDAADMREAGPDDGRRSGMLKRVREFDDEDAPQPKDRAISKDVRDEKNGEGGN